MEYASLWPSIAGSTPTCLIIVSTPIGARLTKSDKLIRISSGILSGAPCLSPKPGPSGKAADYKEKPATRSLSGNLDLTDVFSKVCNVSCPKTDQDFHWLLDMPLKKSQVRRGQTTLFSVQNLNLSDIELANDASASRSQRRQVPICRLSDHLLTWSQVEGILKLIESVEPSSATSSSDDVGIHVENFGVFDVGKPSTIDSRNPAGTLLLQDTLTTTETCDEESERMLSTDLALYTSSPSVPSPERQQLLPSPSYSEAEVAWELCNLHLQGPSETEVDSLCPGLAEDHSDNLQDEGVADRASSSSSRHQRWPGISVSTELPRPTMAFISERERSLMHHYMHRVVNIFCVIDNAKSPWKTIHLPRAIQGAGELSVMGATSRIRNALRNALLSISAYYLSNVQVMSGDTSTCGVHLDGAQQLIIHMGKGKPRLSSKSRALHRIYYYLRVIYESTAPLRSRTCRFSPSSREGVLHMPHSPGQQVSTSTFPFPDEDAISSCSEPVQAASKMASYECIYGIPQSLLVLLQRTIDLIDRVDAARKNHSITSMPKDLDRTCDDIERDIFDWPLDLELTRYRDADIGTSFEIIYHQTHSFHNALIIYFSQNVRLLSHRYLRQYVTEVLHDIETIENIKAESKLLAAPLFWPAFMAATEAHDQRLQDRFRQWYTKVAVYGIKAVRTGTQVVYEVWKRGPSSDGRVTSQWRTVVEETGMTLMLT
ncbi:uncharacterized protein CLUP02_02058 [Colletotrichum lupini]|uniref:Arginine metabolism regulation protein II n=1 Tax=Colletotrichum lupini TaxID=145971 RepID=A0A9Q8SDS9_9PEZI|nr:uncharacterized protein CLUP02_02058 [Colletotrichum lupini]UQC75404.1 hypothetical protein CLUP02_02058 [Colletotrichum lupini]